MYCLAKLDVGGYIYVLDAVRNSAGMFHRGYQVKDFPLAEWFWDKSVARAALVNYDEFVMQFEEAGGCAKLWFTQEQREQGFTKRLSHWAGCYGKYPVAFLNPLAVSA